MSSLRILVVLTVLALVGSATARQCGERWLPGAAMPGTNGIPFAMTEWDPDGPGPAPSVLVVGGKFTAAGSAACGGVATWDGTSWSALGDGLSGSVYTVAVYRGVLYVGGDLTLYGSRLAIARWDGQNWQGVGGGMAGGSPRAQVYAMCEFTGHLYAAGTFTSADGLPAQNIARWDGQSWRAVGGGLTNTSGSPTVYALVRHNGMLAACGVFDLAGGQPSAYVGAWDGSAWIPIGAGLGPRQIGIPWYCLASYKGTLVAGGWSIGPSPGTHLAVWSNGAWKFIPASPLRAFALCEHRGLLYVGGNTHWQTWDGTVLTGLPNRPVGDIQAIAEFRGDLIVAGDFRMVGTTGAMNIARWDGAAWHAVGDGAWGVIYTFGTFKGQTIACGYAVTPAGGEQYLTLGWTGNDWSPIAPALNLDPYAAVEYKGELVVAGYARGNGSGNGILGLAAWNGSTWHTLGSSPIWYALTAAVVNDRLLAVARFKSDSGPFEIGAWDGSSWTILPSVWDKEAWALAEYKGELYAAGQFSVINNVPAKGIARWDGAQWHAVQDGLRTTTGIGSAGSLQVYHDRLVAAGHFAYAGDVAARNIAAWDGQSWESLGGGLAAGAYGLALYKDRLAAVGYKSSTGSGGQNVALWDGADWSSLGYAVPNYARCVGQLGPELIVGGDFTVVDGRVSCMYARYTESGAPWIAVQPSDRRARIGGRVMLEVAAASGYEGTTFRWRRNGIELNDGPSPTGSIVSGASTASLVVTGLEPEDAGEFTCEVFNACGGEVSHVAILGVFCGADLDFNGFVNGDDYDAFIPAFVAGATVADMNTDGFVNGADFDQFIADFESGC